MARGVCERGWGGASMKGHSIWNSGGEKRIAILPPASGDTPPPTPPPPSPSPEKRGCRTGGGGMGGGWGGREGRAKDGSCVTEMGR